MSVELCGPHVAISPAMLRSSNALPANFSEVAALQCLLNKPAWALLMASDSDYGNASLPSWHPNGTVQVLSQHVLMAVSCWRLRLFLLAVDRLTFMMQLGFGDTMTETVWSPVLDNVTLLDSPTTLLAQNRTRPATPMIVGSNSAEGTEFGDIVGVHSSDALVDWFNDSFVAKTANSSVRNTTLGFLHEHYGSRVCSSLCSVPCPCSTCSCCCAHGNYEDYWWAATGAVGDFLVICPTRRAVQIAHKDPCCVLSCQMFTLR